MESTSIWLAFLGGILSFLSPCILPVAPGYLGIISGVSVANLKEGSTNRRQVILATIAFILGFSIVFITLGLSSSYLGQMLRGSRGIIAQISGIVVIFLGLHQAGWLPIHWLYRERKVEIQKSAGIVGAFLMGLAFSLGWTPCVGPILGSILAIAGSKANLGQGILLLVVYSIGLGIPFLLLALAFEKVSRGLNKIKAYLKYIEWTSGILLIVMGILLFTGNMSAIVTWFMQLTGGWNPEDILHH